MVLERDEGGRIIVLQTSRDITARRRADGEREALLARERAARAEVDAVREALAFMASISDRLLSTFDYDERLSLIAALAVPTLADVCSLYLADAAGDGLHLVAVAHADQDKAAILQQFRERRPPRRGDGGAIARVFATGMEEFMPCLDPEALPAFFGNGDELAAVRSLGTRSCAIAPLVAGGRVLGVIFLGLSESDRCYAASDLPRLREYARRAAMALENVRLYREADAARQIAEAERARLQQVIDKLPGGIHVVDRAGRFVACSERASQIFGVDITGQQMPTADTEATEAFGIRRLDGAPIRSRDLPLQRAFFNGETVQGEQLLVRNADTGEDLPLLVDSAPLRNAEGQLTGAIAVFQDISAIKDVERMRDDFLASASHDLRSPLTLVTGMAQVLQRRAAHLAGPDAVQFAAGLTDIDRAAARMRRLLDDLIDLAHSDAGRPLDLQRGPVDLVELARTRASDHQRLTDAHRIHVDTTAQALIGDWDEDRITRVFDNLLSNGVKYSPNGGEITISLATERDDRGDDVVVVRITDPGIGIPADDLPHIFDRYRRGSNVTGRFTGSGIGLAGARQVVEQHGGTIAAESTVGAGTTMTIRLPLQ